MRGKRKSNFLQSALKPININYKQNLRKRQFNSNAISIYNPNDIIETYEADGTSKSRSRDKDARTSATMNPKEKSTTKNFRPLLSK